LAKLAGGVAVIKVGAATEIGANSARCSFVIRAPMPFGVIDRGGLQAASCGCYAADKPPTPGSWVGEKAGAFKRRGIADVCRLQADESSRPTFSVQPTAFHCVQSRIELLDAFE